MKYDIQLIQEQHDSGQQHKYLFFWGHQPSKDGSIIKSCFSQWWISPFKAEGHTFQSAEHWMMYQKAMLFNDEEHAKKVLTVKSPAEAKKIGRKVRNFDAKLWEEKGYDLVREGNFHKFSQHPDLKAFLLSTHYRVLVEAAPNDFIWGIGMHQNDQGVHNPHNWKGTNLLGFALMEVRDQLMT